MCKPIEPDCVEPDGQGRLLPEERSVPIMLPYQGRRRMIHSSAMNRSVFYLPYALLIRRSALA